MGQAYLPLTPALSPVGGEGEIWGAVAPERLRSCKIIKKAGRVGAGLKPAPKAQARRLCHQDICKAAIHGPWFSRSDQKVLVGRASVPAVAGGQGRPPHQFHLQGIAP
jgi:hypothetical protein